MLKFTKKTGTSMLLGGTALVLLILTSVISYKLGERHISELILHSNPPSNNQGDSAPATNDRTLETLRAELTQLANKYESACYNYQELYTAYEALYAEIGANSGHKKIVRPDSARGNAESCYR
ncbi:MAG TPA: hypothetical protein VFT87_00375 [Candidatus Saccharimonadales bacterium]|nr:hypothetical protein [Candidatus Saccharimonadales bacterium]